jgi:hypothetical protein
MQAGDLVQMKSTLSGQRPGLGIVIQVGVNHGTGSAVHWTIHPRPDATNKQTVQHIWNAWLEVIT